MGKLVWGLFQRLDLVKFVESLARREPGAGYAARTGPITPAFADQAEVARRAVDLAERSLAARGEPVGRRELEAQAAIISCRYDAGLHQTLRSAAVNIVAGLFGAGCENLENLFLSRDCRELANLPRLREALREGRGVVYLINHSSHWDEFIFDVFLDIHGLGLPLFAAGQNMMATPSLGKLLMLGSYVILRAGASRAYLSTLFHFCQALGETGKSQGIFLEAWSGGARTRDGSLRYPRRLIALQGALAARNDAFVQPVVLSYSRIPEDQGLSEGRSLASWLNGHRLFREFLKRPWDPWGNLFRGLAGLYGRTYVGLGRGRLASELAAELERGEGGPSELTLDEYASLYAIREIARDKKIMTSQVAARAFSHLKKTRNLAESAARAVEEARDYHRRTFGQDPDFEDYFQERGLAAAMEDGLATLASRGVVRRGLLRRLTGRPPKVLARHCLAYYATHGDRRLYSSSAKENLVVCGSGPWALALVSYLGRRTLADKKYNNS
ncbi:MAG: 1-acyl-sn-glycerol-3-phosphate acyltransferase, partial [Candidatus Adiutrix sp.]|nr:1-acyl-sn-glycerol-3-phosphate acyltransferase [Candidatus Adiutrix sp.]